jgi:hypothetical protein
VQLTNKHQQEADMLAVHCHTDRRGPISKTIDGSTWFDQASAEDIVAFLDGDRWQGNLSSSFAALDFLDFYKDDRLAEIDARLSRDADHDVNVLFDVDPEQGMAWFEANRPDVFEELSRTSQRAYSFA